MNDRFFIATLHLIAEFVRRRHAAVAHPSVIVLVVGQSVAHWRAGVQSATEWVSVVGQNYIHIFVLRQNGDIS